MDIGPDVWTLVSAFAYWSGCPDITNMWSVIVVNSSPNRTIVMC